MDGLLDSSLRSSATGDSAPLASTSSLVLPLLPISSQVRTASIRELRLLRLVVVRSSVNSAYQKDIGDQGAIARLPGNNPSVSGYKESARFNSGSPAPVAIASVPATGIM